MSFYEMVKDNPQFKRYCARQSTRKPAKPKRFKVPIPKPKGMLSVLGEYTTGRMIRCASIRPETIWNVDGTSEKIENRHTWIIEETATLKKIDGEFISIVKNPGNLPVEMVTQKPSNEMPWIFGVEISDKPDYTQSEMAEDAPESPQDDDSATLALIVALEQQNALLRQLAARV
jgi:hypothetical protein